MKLFKVARWLKPLVWLSLASQILIVVTGGLVRLTGSGLGCPTWPKCTDESLVTVPEQGIHGFIEFANRLLTFALLVIALLTLMAVIQSPIRKSNRLLSQAVLLLLGIPAQAVLGGFTVLYKLNPWLVGGHFLLSGFMIWIASVLVWRTYSPTPEVIPQSLYLLSPFTSVFGIVTVIIGVLVTGAGPHSGDAESPRNGLDLEVWQHYHSYPAYVTLAIVLLQVVVLLRTKATGSSLTLKISSALLFSLILQAIVGVIQARLGVPPLLVGIHMFGAATICSLLAFNHLASRVR